MREFQKWDKYLKMGENNTPLIHELSFTAKNDEELLQGIQDDAPEEVKQEYLEYWREESKYRQECAKNGTFYAK